MFGIGGHTGSSDSVVFSIYLVREGLRGFRARPATSRADLCQTFFTVLSKRFVRYTCVRAGDGENRVQRVSEGCTSPRTNAVNGFEWRGRRRQIPTKSRRRRPYGYAVQRPGSGCATLCRSLGADDLPPPAIPIANFGPTTFSKRIYYHTRRRAGTYGCDTMFRSINNVSSKHLIVRYLKL